jgi:endonuclease III
MKDGTLYASRLKKAYTKHRQSVPEPVIPESDDPIRRLAIGILGVECGDDVADRAIDRGFLTLIDWNELRVSRVDEVHKAIGDSIPQAALRCKRLIDALQSIYGREHRISLDRLQTIGRREARIYLEALAGVDDYAAAGVVLWSLGGHAIPVNDPLLGALREADLIHPTATRSEVQAFLERHVSAAQAKEFAAVMRSFKSSKRGASESGRSTKPAKAKGAAK